MRSLKGERRLHLGLGRGGEASAVNAGELPNVQDGADGAAGLSESLAAALERAAQVAAERPGRLTRTKAPLASKMPQGVGPGASAVSPFDPKADVSLSEAFRGRSRALDAKARERARAEAVRAVKGQLSTEAGAASGPSLSERIGKAAHAHKGAYGPVMKARGSTSVGTQAGGSAFARTPAEPAPGKAPAGRGGAGPVGGVARGYASFSTRRPLQGARAAGVQPEPPENISLTGSAADDALRAGRAQPEAAANLAQGGLRAQPRSGQPHIHDQASDAQAGLRPRSIAADDETDPQVPDWLGRGVPAQMPGDAEGRAQNAGHDGGAGRKSGRFSLKGALRGLARPRRTAAADAMPDPQGETPATRPRTLQAGSEPPVTAVFRGASSGRDASDAMPGDGALRPASDGEVQDAGRSRADAQPGAQQGQKRATGKSRSGRRWSLRLKRGGAGGRGRRDPAPSRLAYRLHRLWLRPRLRRFLLRGVPALLLAWAAGAWLAQEEHQDALRSKYHEILASIEARPEFSVSRMEILGASEAVAEDIREIMPVDLPASVFDLDLEAMKARISELGAVAQADLRIRKGGVLELRITERHPVAIWRYGHDLVLLDAEGHQVAVIASRLERPGLPLLAGAGAEAAVPEALDLLAAAAPVGPRIRGLVRIGERRWDLVLDGDQRILLPERQPVKALQKVMALDRAQDLLARAVQIIDMRNPARPTLRLAPAAAEMLQGAGFTPGEHSEGANRR